MSEPQTREYLIRWLISLGGLVTGVASTVVGSWISSRFHIYDENRRVHLEALRDCVLKPLRAGLEDHLKPVLTRKVPVVCVVHDAKIFHPHAKVTEQSESFANVLAGVFPFGGIYQSVEMALLHDARTHHFTDLMKTIDSFLKECIDYAGECQAWIARVAGELTEASGLPPFAPNQTGFYVMNCRLAHFVYLRLFQLPSGNVKKDEGGNRWILNYGAYVAAVGTSEQIDTLVNLLDKLVEAERDHAAQLQRREAGLREKFTRVSESLDFAAASCHLHGRCDLVPFL